MNKSSPAVHDPIALPTRLPAPYHDDAADHLVDSPLPRVALPSTLGGTERLDVVPKGYERRVVFVYPRTGRPGEPPLIQNWDAIPGARGCTPEACGFRDHWREFKRVGAYVVGLSTQDSEYQREATVRLALPFPLLSDAGLRVSSALKLPTFEADGWQFLKRITLIIAQARIEHVFYPVFPPDSHAEEVLRWLRKHQRSESP